ncbi:Rieske domain-containing protein-like [Diadema antillarum]|uniref:Rieske domain-containing protein-like n=1 Tax=Diadema antillarum TaxID=105358 RepID=UPI003A877927
MPGQLSTSPQARFIEELIDIGTCVDQEKRRFMSESNGVLYFRVETVKFEELYDWSNPEQKWKSHQVSGRQLRRSNSMPTGSLVSLNEDNIALFRYGELLFAVGEKCPHLGGPLHLGDIEVLPDMSICVKCPWHKWCIDLTSGEVKLPEGRKEKSSTTYPTKIDEEGHIFVGFRNFSGKYFSGDADF